MANEGCPCCVADGSVGGTAKGSIESMIMGIGLGAAFSLTAIRSVVCPLHKERFEAALGRMASALRFTFEEAPRG